MALAAYRHVLQSFRIAFRDDARMLSAARVEARFKFESSRSLDSDSLEVKNKVAEAEEVARILRQNLVQGQQLKGAEEGEQTFRTLALSLDFLRSPYVPK
ncbi:Mitochondrial zinc maintenance protein 1, mitochondrial [Lecanora helva]